MKAIIYVLLICLCAGILQVAAKLVMTEPPIINGTSRFICLMGSSKDLAVLKPGIIVVCYLRKSMVFDIMSVLRISWSRSCQHLNSTTFAEITRYYMEGVIPYGKTT